MAQRTNSIPRTALRLGLSYNQVLRLVLTGRLRGSQKTDGHWIVDGEDVERFANESGCDGTKALLSVGA